MQNTPHNSHNAYCLIRQSKGKEQSVDRKPSKILPHITKQFDFKIANRLLIQKIISPRRDRTIIESLNNTSCKYHSKNKKQSKIAQSFNHRRKIQLNKSKPNQNQQTPIANIQSKSKPQKHYNKMEVQDLEEAADEYPNFLSENGDLTQSKWKYSQQAVIDCDNKPFIGKIIRNSSNFFGLLTRRTNQNNFLENDLQTNESLFISAMKTQCRVKERWRGTLIRKNGSNQCNKQNMIRANDQMI